MYVVLIENDGTILVQRITSHPAVENVDKQTDSDIDCDSVAGHL